MSWEQKWAGIIWVGEQSIQPNGKVFERVSRSPGSRLIFVHDGNVLLSREARKELGGNIDHRLPGGKVFDTNEEYQEFLSTGEDILEASRKSACKEALEEVGLVVTPNNLEYLSTDVLGATCYYDLIYWVCEQFDENDAGAEFHGTEADEIKGGVWIPIVDACRLALNKDQFSESRSALAVLSYAQSKGFITI